MDIHIGRLIEQRIKEVGMTKAEFGRRINTSRQNVNTLLKKNSLDTEMLWRISEVLNFDFFQCFLGAAKVTGAKKQPAGPVVKLVIELPAWQQDRMLELVMGPNFKDFFTKA